MTATTTLRTAPSAGLGHGALSGIRPGAEAGAQAGTEPGAAAGRTATPGGLVWAFHEGFTAYVTRLADGRLDLDGGATRRPDGRVVFPAAREPAADVAAGHGADGAADDAPAGGPAGRCPAPEASAVPILRCAGSVHYTGHHGLLAVALAEPALEPASAVGAGAGLIGEAGADVADRAADGAGVVLTISDPFTPGQRMILAELGPSVPTEPTVPGAGHALLFPEPRLTESGADLFLGHYRAGMPLAPLEVLIAETAPAPGHPCNDPFHAPFHDQDA